MKTNLEKSTEKNASVLDREHKGTVSVIGSATMHPEMSFPSTSTVRITTMSATGKTTLSV
mgnify:CR=1 FL=1